MNVKFIEWFFQVYQASTTTRTGAGKYVIWFIRLNYLSDFCFTITKVLDYFYRFYEAFNFYY